MPDRVFIYALKDPNTDTPCYVGRSYDPNVRLQNHIASSKKQRSPIEKWIHNLIIKNQKPILEILEECYQHSCDEREDYWIDRLSISNILLNRNRISEESSGIRTYDKDNSESEFVNVNEAAALRKTTRQTIHTWLKRGLAYRKQYNVKFIKRADLLAFEPGKAGRKKESK